MHRSPLAGLKVSRHLLAKTVASCLGSESRLPYNWSDQLRGFVLAIALARSVVLQDVARTFGGLIKTVEDRLSNFLGQDKKRLCLDLEHRRYVIELLRRTGRKAFVRYRGKLVLIVDTRSGTQGVNFPKNSPCTSSRIHFQR